MSNFKPTTEKVYQAIREASEIGTHNPEPKAMIANALASQNVAESIQVLHHAIPLTVNDLRSTITKNTDNIIESNSKLQSGAEKYTKAMTWLTAGLFFVGIVQIVVQIFQIVIKN